MFDPKLEVSNLKLCRRLKELGYPQEGGGWYWRKFDGFKDSKYELVLIERWEKGKVILAYDIVKAPHLPRVGGVVAF